MDYVKWSCAGCQRLMESPEWPETSTPLCAPCTRSRDLGDARRELKVALRLGEEMSESPLVLAMARLVYELTDPKGSTRDWTDQRSWPADGEHDRETWMPAERDDVEAWDEGPERRSRTQPTLHVPVSIPGHSGFLPRGLR